MKTIQMTLAWLVGLLAAVLLGPATVRRVRFSDVAFTYRMGAGFPGDVTRFHPNANILPALVTPSGQVPRAYGDPVLIDGSTNAVRGYIAGDNNASAAATFGFLVRSFPTQQQSGGMTSGIGAATPPTSGVVDVMRAGYIMGKVPAGTACVKGGTVYVWCAANSGSNVQGQLVASATGGSTLPLSNAKFVGPADANGNVEIELTQA